MTQTFKDQKGKTLEEVQHEAYKIKKGKGTDILLAVPGVYGSYIPISCYAFVESVKSQTRVGLKPLVITKKVGSDLLIEYVYFVLD